MNERSLTGKVEDSEQAAGGCLCGAVRYEVLGPMRDVELCHCAACRRWHGHVCAMTSAPAERVRLVADGGLRWIDSPDSAAHARRGFCGECGSSLFWDAPDLNTISIAAGTLDAPTGLRIVRQIYTADAGDYYELDPGLESFPGSGDSAGA
jgi:hypothetical protein